MIYCSMLSVTDRQTDRDLPSCEGYDLLLHAGCNRHTDRQTETYLAVRGMI